MNKADWLIHDAENDVKRTREKLRESAQSLRRDLARLERILEVDAGRYSVNSLGEVQGRGCEIDRLCGVLDAKQGSLERLKFALEPEVKEET